MANNLVELFDQYDWKKTIACVKDEESNLNLMMIILKSIVTCEVLGLDESFNVLVLAMFF